MISNGMDQNQAYLNKYSTYISFVLKVSVVTIVLFFWLTYDIKPVDVPLDYEILYDEFVVNQFDTVRDEPIPFEDTVLQETIDSILTPVFHEAWDAPVNDDFWLVKLDGTCEKYRVYCNKVTYEWVWSNKDKYMYTAIAVFFMASIDNKLQREENLASTMQLLTLRQREDKARGYASRTKLYLHLPMMKTMEEFAGVLVHELGHIIDVWVINGSGKELDQKFTEFGKPAFYKNDFSLGFYELSRQSEKVRKKTAGELSFCSGYWMSNVFEDFAECFKLYLFNHNYFFSLAQSDPILYKKYQYIANLFDGDYIKSSSTDRSLAQNHIASKKRAWDSTRL